MAKVIGIGGLFTRTGSADELRAWYARVLGIEFESWGGIAFPPLEKGATVFSPFAADTGYFAPSTREFMVNFVVDDIDAMLKHVESEGVAVLGRSDDDAMGRFAWIMDPASVKIELWQPPENSSA